MFALRTARQLWILTIAIGLTVTALVGGLQRPAYATAGTAAAPGQVSVQAAGCDNSLCLFSGTNFTGTTFNAGFPGTTCSTAPFPAQSATNDTIFHMELYSDASCGVFDFFLESGKANANLPAPARSYKAFICGQQCSPLAGDARHVAVSVR